MKNFEYFLLLLLGFGGMISGHGQIELTLNKYLDSVYGHHVIPGFSVVVAKGNDIIYTRGFGKEVLGGSKNFTANSVSAIGSLTKSITAIAILQLVEKGDLDLDKHVVNYLPSFRTANKAMSDKITVRILLNNTSGLVEDLVPSYDLSDKALEYLSQGLQSTFISKTPGTSYAYSNVAFGIAGLLISKVSGMSYLDYIEKKIFIPLQMNSTTSNPSKFSQLGALEGHYFSIDNGIPAIRESQTESGEFIPAGSFTRSSANDLGNYLIALLNRGSFKDIRILSEESVKTMWEPNVLFPGLTKEEGGNGSTFQYGLGWMISNIDGRKIIHHGGSTGKMSSFTMIDLENNVAATILANIDLTFIDQYSYPTSFTILNNVLHLVTQEPISEYGKPQVIDVTKNKFHLDKQQQAKFIGTYRFEKGGDHWINFGLQLNIQKTENGELKAMLSRGEQIVNEFYLDFINPSQAVSRNIAAPQRIVFKIEPDGKIKKMIFFGTTFVKVENERLAQTHNYVDNKEGLHFLIPKDYNIVWTANGFNANKKNDNMSNYFGLLYEKESKSIKVLLKEIFPDTKILYKGTISFQNIGGLVLGKQSFLIKERGIHKSITILDSRINSKKMFLVFKSPLENHTSDIQNVIFPFLNSFEALKNPSN